MTRPSMERYHTAIIGAGAAGMTVAVSLSKAGKKVVVVERDQVGGDCTNVGCIPSKALIHLSHQVARKELSPEEALKRVRRSRDELREEETEWLGGLKGLTLKFGEAKFSSPNSLDLYREGKLIEEVHARNIVIATGARPREIEIKGLTPQDLLSNESIFELEAPPNRLVIVGAGAIGVELAFAFSRLGSAVTLVDALPRVLSREEPESSELMQECLTQAGVELRLQAKVVEFEQQTRSLHLEQDTGSSSVTDVDKVLVAIGRQPNIDLDLSRIGIPYSQNGIATDPSSYTGVGRVYAIGDVTECSAFTHSANHQGRRLFKRLLFPLMPKTSEPHYPSVVYSSPEVARVGPPLQQLQKRYRSQLLKTVRFELKDTDRAYTDSVEQGFVMLHAVRLTGTVLSATIVAPQAGEMLPLLTHAVNNKVSLYSLSELVFAYPTLSEAIKKAADQFVVETVGSIPSELSSYITNRFRRVK